MATPLEKYSYRQFRNALNAQYVEALENLAFDGVMSANWIKIDEIQGAYNRVWSTTSLYEGKKTMRAILGYANIVDDAWKANTLTYVNKVAGSRITEVWAESKKQYIKAVNDAVLTATNEGLGVEATQRRIRKLVTKKLGGDVNIWRARRIAQTEVISAGNYGSHEAMRQSVSDGARIMKQWRVGYGGKDPRHGTYPGLDGQVRAVDKPFDVNGYAMMFPGDPAGPASEVINCYCNTTAVEDFGIGFINMR